MHKTFRRGLIDLSIFCAIFLISNNGLAMGIDPVCTCHFGKNMDCEEIEIKDVWSVFDLSAADEVEEKAECEKNCTTKRGTSAISKYASNQASGASYIASCESSHKLADAALQAKSNSDIIPKLQIKIDGVDFKKPVRTYGLISSSFLADYVSGVYKYLLTVSVGFAIVMVMVGGLQYVLSAGMSEQLAKGKKRMKDGVIGLVLLIGTYLILYTVNPQLTLFGSLALEVPLRKELDIEHEDHDEEDEKSSYASDKITKPGIVLTEKHRGEAIGGRCHFVPIGGFPKFDLKQFGDNGIGRCLLEEYAPEIGTKGIQSLDLEMVEVNFFGKKTKLHQKIKPVLEKIESEITALNSPIVKHWVANYKSAGMRVNSMPMRPVIQACAEAGAETWVVVKKDGSKDRILTKVLKILHGNYDGTIGGDLHPFGIAIDMYSRENWDFKKGKTFKRPMVTQIPAEVAEIFHNNKFQWLGSSAGRDPMHFQYRGSPCYVGTGRKFPSGSGCCMNPWSDASNAPQFEKCIEQGGQNTSYEDCLGSNGQPGNMWVKESVEPK